jgi:DNA polymerase III subunit delta'
MARKKTEEIEITECGYPILKEELCGHLEALNILEKSLINRSFSTTVLISGPPRVGKTSLAYILSAALECEKPTPWACGVCSPCRKIKRNLFPDLRFISLEESDKGKLKSQILVDQVRKQVLDVIELPPYEGKRLIFMIEPAEALNVNSQNALLKVLEEPPSYANFILIAKDFGPLLPTVRSRCQEIHLSEIGDAEMEQVIKKLGISAKRKEALEVSRGRPGILISGEWEEFLNLRKAIERFLLLGSSYKNYGELAPLFDVLLEYPPVVVLDEAAYVIKEVLREDIEQKKDKGSVYRRIIEESGRESLYRKAKAILETPPLLVRNIQPKLIYQTIFLDFARQPEKSIIRRV